MATRIEAPPSRFVEFRDQTKQPQEANLALPTTVSHRNLPAPNHPLQLHTPRHWHATTCAQQPLAPDNPTCQKVKLVAITCHAGPGQDFQTEVRGSDSKKARHAETRVGPSARGDNLVTKLNSPKSPHQTCTQLLPPSSNMEKWSLQ